jgi:predicted dehydrogenase
MGRTYGVGVYGIGWAAGAHITALLQNPRIRIAALGSRNPESARKQRDAYRIEECRIVGSFEEMLAMEEVDVVDICTPNALHAAEAIAAAEAGKHLIIEKPVAMNLAELRALREAVHRSGVKSQTCFESRWNPHVASLRRMIDQDGLGRVYYVEVDYYHEIGPWWHGYTWGCNTHSGGPSATLVASCHAVDLMRYFGGEITEVKAYGCHGHRSDYEYAPTYASIVKFENGGIGKTGCSFEIESPYVMNIILHGSGGSVYNDRFFTRNWFSGQSGWQRFNTIFLDSGDVSHHPYKGMIDQFVEALDGSEEPWNNIDSAYRSHEVCLAIDRSVDSGEAVALPLESTA